MKQSTTSFLKEDCFLFVSPSPAPLYPQQSLLIHYGTTGSSIEPQILNHLRMLRINTLTVIDKSLSAKRMLSSRKEALLCNYERQICSVLPKQKLWKHLLSFSTYGSRSPQSTWPGLFWSLSPTFIFGQLISKPVDKVKSGSEENKKNDLWLGQNHYLREVTVIFRCTSCLSNSKAIPWPHVLSENVTDRLKEHPCWTKGRTFLYQKEKFKLSWCPNLIILGLPSS